jgi:hypothetical protein
MTRMARSFTCALALGTVAALAGACSSSSPVAPSSMGAEAGAQAVTTSNACWGQATQVFARTGVMGQHASQEDTPRAGLRNLARSLYQLGLLPDDSLQSLGAFVAVEYKLSIDACL